MRRAFWAAVVVSTVGCEWIELDPFLRAPDGGLVSDTGGGGAGGGGTAGGGGDAGGGTADAGVGDASVSDSGVSDSGVSDSGVGDASVSESGVSDSGVGDSGVGDSGVSDSGVSDSGVSDASVSDAGSPRLVVGSGSEVMIWDHADAPNRTPDQTLAASQPVTSLVLSGQRLVAATSSTLLVAWDDLQGPRISFPLLFPAVPRQAVRGSDTAWYLAPNGLATQVLQPEHGTLAISSIVNAGSGSAMTSIAYDVEFNRLYACRQGWVVVFTPVFDGGTPASAEQLSPVEAGVLLTFGMDRLFGAPVGGAPPYLLSVWDTASPITLRPADHQIPLSAPVLDLTVAATGQLVVSLQTSGLGKVLIFGSAGTLTSASTPDQTITHPTIDAMITRAVLHNQTLFVGDSNGVSVFRNALTAPTFVTELGDGGPAVDLLVVP